MRKPFFHFLAAGFLTLTPAATVNAQTPLEKARRDQVAIVPPGDPDMEAAFRKARATLKDFLALVRAPRPSITNYAVKIGISDGGETEYFWVSRFTQADGRLAGKIDNTPRLVRSVRQGQMLRFDEGEVVDWLYRENGKMIGNFTACALIKKEPPQQAEAFKKQYGLNCDP